MNMAQSTAKHTLQNLLGHIAKLDGTEKDPIVLQEIAEFRDPRVWRSLMEDAGLERASFFRTYDVVRDDLLDRLAFSYIQHAWSSQPLEGLAAAMDGDSPSGSRPNRRVSAFGYLGLFLLTAALYDQIDARQTPRNNGPADSGQRIHNSDGSGSASGGGGIEQARLNAELPYKLLLDQRVREAIRELYRPTRDQTAANEWRELDFSTLEFHAVGTTSFIARVFKTEDTGHYSPYALKLLLYPYTRYSVIAEATRAYGQTWAPRVVEQPTGDPAGNGDLRRAQWRYLVKVHKSTDKWILMEFVPGRTLEEFLDGLRDDRERDPSTWRRKLAELGRRLGRRGAGGHSAPRWRRKQADLGLWLQDKAEQPPRPEIRLELLADLGKQLFDALDELQQTTVPKAHLDLSLSNVIVTELPSRSAQESSFTIKLVDFGRNHLYTRQIGAIESAAAFTVAPEVKEDPGPAEGGGGPEADDQPASDTAWYADAYSLGHLLIALGGVGRNEDGTVPDEFYERTPLLARFIEDLIEHDPGKRLLLFGPSLAAVSGGSQGQDRPFAQLGSTFLQELHAVRAARLDNADPNHRQWLRSTWQFISPFSGVLRPLWRLRDVRRRQALLRDPERSMYARGLLNWALLCAALFCVIWSLCLVWLARDLADPRVEQLPPLARLIKLSSSWSPFDLALEDDDYPVPWLRWLDRFQQPSYDIPNLADNLPARIIGLSFALLGVKVYQTLFAGLSPLVAGPRRLRTWVTAASMRWYTFNWAVLVAFANLVHPAYWTVCTAIGLTTSFLTNWTCRRFARTSISEARSRTVGLTTVPRGKIPGLEAFYVWTPSMGFYLVFVWVCAWLIDNGYLRDVYFYMSAVAAVNIGLFYLVKCGRHGAMVRGGLTRAFFAAERVRRLAERPAGAGPAPPQDPAGQGDRVPAGAAR
jgi:serine/threonine protein kinase